MDYLKMYNLNMDYVLLGVMILGFILLGILACRKSEANDFGEMLEQLREKLDDDLGDRSGELKRDVRDSLLSFNSIFHDNLNTFSSGQSSSIHQLQDGMRNQFEVFSTNQEKQIKLFSTDMGEKISLLGQIIAELKRDNVQSLKELQILVNQELEKVRSENDKLQKENSQSVKDLQLLVNGELEKMRKDNDEKLEKIRKSVDDQLQSTLEKSVQQSFNSVLNQLQQVDKSLGEMQNLAKDVGGLKKILGNVKTRGNFGEVQLETILDEIIPGRYEKQVMIREGSQDRVDFAISLPGDAADKPVLLPIDSKFPSEAFDKLQSARESGDKDAIEQATKELRTAVRTEAKSIHDKYIQIPRTTAFAIMFLAAESIYAEVVSQTDLVNEIRRELQVNIAGPSTMAAFLNSLQMGFHTLKLRESAGKIGEVLKNTKTQFGKFAGVLENMRKHLDSTSNDLDKLITTRTNTIMRALDKIEGYEEVENVSMVRMLEEGDEEK